MQGVDQQQHQPLCKSTDAPVLRQAVGPLLNHMGWAVTAKDLVFLQINSDKGKYIFELEILKTKETTDFRKLRRNVKRIKRNVMCQFGN